MRGPTKSEVLRLALDECDLTETERTILTLVYWERYTLTEAAALMGRTSVHGELHRAKEKLRRYFCDEGTD